MAMQSVDRTPIARVTWKSGHSGGIPTNESDEYDDSIEQVLHVPQRAGFVGDKWSHSHTRTIEPFDAVKTPGSEGGAGELTLLMLG